MGSAVAGGIGLAGYKMFGPGDADRTGGNLSLFAPKPQQASSEAVAPAGDGSSASLSMMAQSAAKDKAAEDAEAAASAVVAAPDENVAGSGAADATAAEAAARAATAGALNSGGGAGATGSMRSLANVKKLGALSGSTGGGASTSAGSGTAGRLGDNNVNAARNGASSSFSKGGASAKASSGRTAMGGRGRSARGQARQVMGDQANGRAGSSFAAGKTYDGSTTGGGGAIGPDGGAIGMDGADTGAGEHPKSIAKNSTKDTNEREPEIPEGKEMITPWAQACQRATMLVMLAAALAFAASKVPPGPYAQMLLWVIAAAIGAIGVYVGVLAGQIMSGPYGQKAQGMVCVAASLGVLTMAGAVAAGAAATTETTSGLAGGGGAMAAIYLGGGAAAIAGIALMMMPKPKQIELREGEKRPDVRYEAKPNPVRYMV